MWRLCLSKLRQPIFIAKTFMVTEHRGKAHIFAHLSITNPVRPSSKIDDSRLFVLG